MLFSSNQKLVISGDIHDSYQELEDALLFVLKKSDWFAAFTRTENPAKCVWQITGTGAYVLGWEIGDVDTAWTEYPFDFDVSIITQIIVQFLRKSAVECGSWDGSYKQGFILSYVKQMFSTEYEGIKNPSHAIVRIEPYTCFYHS